MTMETKLFTMADMARDFDTYPTQIRAMIDHYRIPSQRVGKALVVDQAGYDAVRKAVETFKSQPRITKPKSRSEPATA